MVALEFWCKVGADYQKNLFVLFASFADEVFEICCTHFLFTPLSAVIRTCFGLNSKQFDRLI